MRHRDILDVREIRLPGTGGVVKLVAAKDIMQLFHQRVILHHIDLDFHICFVLLLVVQGILHRVSAHDEGELDIRLHVVRTIRLMADERLHVLGINDRQSHQQHKKERVFLHLFSFLISQKTLYIL